MLANWKRVVVLAVACAVAALVDVKPGLAVDPNERLSDPALEQRARSISAGLRCLVCQNQSIDDSDAPLAKDLRVLVRERLVAGDSNEAVLDYVVSRYGEFVLLKPPFNMRTLLLWLAPLLILFGVTWYLWRAIVPSRGATAGTVGSTAETAPLTKEEQQRLDRLLSDAGGQDAGDRRP